ncbi:hypothetical protein ABEY41_03075 [Peribacillus butanolivorans]
MKPIDTSLLVNTLTDVISFDVKPHEIGCTKEELVDACKYMFLRVNDKE